jgi:hypothetical protein
MGPSRRRNPRSRGYSASINVKVRHIASRARQTMELMSKVDELIKNSKKSE